MPSEQSKAVVVRYTAGFNGGNFGIYDEVFDTDCVIRINSPANVVGLDAYKQGNTANLQTFPDLHYELVEVVAEGDRVMSWWKQTGTFTGPMADGTPPTGKQFETDLFGYYRMANGKIAEAYYVYDRLGVYRQLGIAPPTR